MNLSTPESRGKIIAQYRAAVGALDQMFQAARPRTNNEGWRKDGVGSCALIHNKEDSELNLTGIARDELIRLREIRDREFGGESTLTGCPYHRANHGCVLGDLKAPVCISHFESGSYSEWRRRFGLRTGEFSSDISIILKAILEGKTLGDELRVATFVEYVSKKSKIIEAEPILHNPPLRDRLRITWRHLMSF